MTNYGIWVVYIMLAGHGVPVNDEARFTTESACQVYLGMKYSRLPAATHCTNIGPLICQGKPC